MRPAGRRGLPAALAAATAGVAAGGAARAAYAALRRYPPGGEKTWYRVNPVSYTHLTLPTKA